MTLTADEARSRYAVEYQGYESAAERIADVLKALVRSSGVRADIDARAKSIASFSKKLYLKRTVYSDLWADVTDKVGARITVGNLPDLRRVRDIFEGQDCSLNVLRVEDKLADADVGTLFYPGVHIQVVVPECTTSSGETIECEVQLRTKAQDLWSVPSHDLVYKPILAPSRTTHRRVMRLSVLAEIFDEEVASAMAEVEAQPRYRLARLLRESEALYLTFVAEPGVDELSLDVLTIIEPAIPDSEDAYAGALSQFISTNRLKLEKLFADFGPYSSVASEWAYWLFSQPEVLIVLQLVEQRAMSLANTTVGTDIEQAVRTVYGAWGKSFPECK